MMCVRLNSLVKRNSGCHPDVINQLVDFINHSITPIVPRIGSLGASGDLAPLSHLACALVGEGRVEYQGDIIDAMEAIRRCELAPLVLRAKDGLSLINGKPHHWYVVSCCRTIAPIIDIFRHYCCYVD